MLHVTLNEQLGFLAIRRRGNSDYAKYPGTDFFRDRFNGASLARGIPAFEHDDNARLVRFHPLLKIAKFDLELVELPCASTVTRAYLPYFTLPLLQSFQAGRATSRSRRW